MSQRQWEALEEFQAGREDQICILERRPPENGLEEDERGCRETREEIIASGPGRADGTGS